MKESCTSSPTGAEFYNPATTGFRIPVAVSACLLGQPVRYDGRNKSHPFIDTQLDAALRLIPVCPEVEAGFGVPRPPVQLVATDSNHPPRALGRDNPALDVSDDLRRQAVLNARRLIREQKLCGYLWKSRSPSCGFTSTPIHDGGGNLLGFGSGIQARLFQKQLPWLAHSEESALQTPGDASCFIWRCRLVFDVMYAGNAKLPELHRHYQNQTWFTLLPDTDRRFLDDTARANRPRRYLAALHTALTHIPSERLHNLCG